MLKIRSFVYLALLFFVALFAVVNVIGNVWEKRAQEHWAKTFGPIDDLQKVFPARSDNDSAVQLKKLAQLGIEFTVPHEEDQFSPIYIWMHYGMMPSKMKVHKTYFNSMSSLILFKRTFTF